MQSYDYTHRKGIDEISWDRFAQLAMVLAEKLGNLEIDMVVGIARAGLFPATAVACMLRKELFPVRITRRVNDQVTHKHPVWKVGVSAEVKGKAVAVVDEMADTGETLSLVAAKVKEQGASKIITASLIAHSWANPMPKVTALITDALVVFPWDKQIYANEQWQTHPELVAALGLQGKQ